MKDDMKDDNNMKDHMNNDMKDNIRKYGTFFDSKKEMIQLYILFIFFGIHEDIIKELPNIRHTS